MIKIKLIEGFVMKVFFALSLAVWVVACAQNPSSSSRSVDEKTLAETRDVALQLVSTLGATLKKEIAANGTASAISVCNEAAPEIAASLSQQKNWQIGRVGTRVRNADNQANDWQQAALATFADKAAQGEKFEQMETYSVSQEGGKPMLRYAKAIALQPMCVQCHGQLAQISSDVKARLKVFYPADKAVDYNVGELRGAVVIVRPLE
jgi:hypothetical protein